MNGCIQKMNVLLMKDFPCFTSDISGIILWVDYVIRIQSNFLDWYYEYTIIYLRKIK